MASLKSVSLSQLRGLTANEVKRLGKVGLRTTAALVKAAPTSRKEQALAKKAGISLARMREAVNRADLVQVKGMGPAKADLLENAGVNSTRELSKRSPAALAKTLARYVDSHRELNYRAPDLKTLAVLVQRAQALVGGSAVTTLDEAKDRAAAALTSYVTDVLFTDDPRGESFRTAIRNNRPAAEWPALQASILAEIPAYVGRGPSPLNNSALDEAVEDDTGFQLTGRLFGLYTELKVMKPGGEIQNLLVEID